MKKNVFMCTAMMALSGMVTAQEFEWGYPFAIKDETGSEVQHIADDNIYRLASIYDLDIFNYRITADAISADRLEKRSTVELGGGRYDGPKHHSHHQKEGEKFIFYSTETDRNTSANNLYWQEVNIETGDKSETSIITSIEGKSNMNNGQFLTAMSPNKQYHAVLKEAAFYKKENEKIALVLFDADMNELAALPYEYEWEAKRGPQHSVHVDNAGNVYVVKRSDLPKQKPFQTIFVWQRNSQTLAAHSLEQEDNYQIAQMVPHFQGDAFYLIGLLTSDGATTFGMKIGHTGVYGEGLLCSKFSASGDLQYTQRSEFSQSATSSLSIKEILSDDSSLWVVMERMNEESKTNPSTDIQAPKTYTYTYNNLGFLFSRIEAATGKAAWTGQIDTAEPQTTNDNGAYLSVLPMLHGGNLHLLYNETQEKSDSDGKYRIRVPALTLVTPEGAIAQTTYLSNSGLRNARREVFELDTEDILPLGGNKFLVRARDGRTVKYGYLKM